MLAVQQVLSTLQDVAPPRARAPSHLELRFRLGQGQGRELGSGSQEPGLLPQELIQEWPWRTDMGTRATRKLFNSTK